jgi:hypothetical protein
MSDSNEEIKIDIVELNGKLDRITDNIETVKIKCDDISICVNKVKKAVYDPDQGLYARLREIEQWKENTSKIIWVISTSIIGLATATVWHTFFK